MTAVNYGSIKVTDIYRGKTHIWSYSPLAEVFAIGGVLENWIIEGISALTGGLGGVADSVIYDGLGNLVNGIGTAIGNIVKFIPNPKNIASTIVNLAENPKLTIGVMIAQIPEDLSAFDEAICAQLNTIPTSIQDIWNGVASGLTGFLVDLENNIYATLGGIIATLADILSGNIHPLKTIVQMVGTNTITTDLATVLGILADQTTGAISNAINFITDATGTVAGWLTCGGFQQFESDVIDAIQFPIGALNNLGRMLVPNGLVSLPVQSSMARSTAAMPADDGYLETSIGSIGTPGFVTQLFRRWDSTGAALSGVGLDLRSSLISIVRRAAGDTQIVAPSIGSYINGDVLRLQQVGDTHTLFKNGSEIGQWVDNASSAVIGAANRSVAMAMEASQTLLGPTNYSPSLNYVVAA